MLTYEIFRYWQSFIINNLWLVSLSPRKHLSIILSIPMQLKIFCCFKILNIIQNDIAAPVIWPTFENTLLAMQVIRNVTMIRFLDNVQPSFILMSEIVLGLSMIFQGECMKSGAKMVVISTQFKKVCKHIFWWNFHNFS